MSTYAIGDVQGCFDALMKLLDKIKFDPHQDKLWFTGDLINRGPDSLSALRFIKNLGKNHVTVLGNHDLHLLAVANAAHAGWPEDTLKPILEAHDKNELLHWLTQQPLLHYDEKLNYLMVHAGIAPMWDLKKAIQLAHEVTETIQGPHAKEFYQHMYGNTPILWNDNLQGWERIRCITNYFTRMRFCHPDGSLELKNKGKLDGTIDLTPWFLLPRQIPSTIKIIFGHWAALGGITNAPNIYALDTGCVWGYCLTAMRLEDNQRFSVGC